MPDSRSGNAPLRCVYCQSDEILLQNCGKCGEESLVQCKNCDQRVCRDADCDIKALGKKHKRRMMVVGGFAALVLVSSFLFKNRLDEVKLTTVTPDPSASVAPPALDPSALAVLPPGLVASPAPLAASPGAGPAAADPLAALPPPAGASADPLLPLTPAAGDPAPLQTASSPAQDPLPLPATGGAPGDPFANPVATASGAPLDPLAPPGAGVAALPANPAAPADPLAQLPGAPGGAPDPLAQLPGTPGGAPDPLAQLPGTPGGGPDPLAQLPGTPGGGPDPLAQLPGTPGGAPDPLAQLPGTPLGAPDPLQPPPTNLAAAGTDPLAPIVPPAGPDPLPVGSPDPAAAGAVAEVTPGTFEVPGAGTPAASSGPPGALALGGAETPAGGAPSGTGAASPAGGIAASGIPAGRRPLTEYRPILAMLPPSDMVPTLDEGQLRQGRAVMDVTPGSVLERRGPDLARWSVIPPRGAALPAGFMKVAPLVASTTAGEGPTLTPGGPAEAGIPLVAPGSIPTAGQIREVLRKSLGRPYKADGIDPEKGGLSPGGFVKYVYSQIGFGSMVPRDVQDQMEMAGRPIFPHNYEPQVGDVLFFKIKSDLNHVGIYYGRVGSTEKETFFTVIKGRGGVVMVPWEAEFFKERFLFAMRLIEKLEP